MRPDAAVFIRANTAIATPSLVPEIRLHLATEITPIWQASEDALARANVPPPFWAFPWAGGQALARYVLDNPAVVAGLRVLDFGAGSGLVAVAAAQSGAARVVAAEIDDVAAAAIALIGTAAGRWDVVLVGDMCYEQPLAARLTAWLRVLAGSGVTILLGDPGRSYVPTSGLVAQARYKVATSLELEDRTSRDGVVWRVEATES
jgi:predicted nicotinamide N-methyase